MNERKLVAVAALLGLVLFAGAVFFQPAQAQSKGKQAPPTAEENRAELEKKYAETEDLVKVASTDKRPGIAAWSEIQGSADTLTWPAKYYLPWPAGEATLAVTHDGSGKPWAGIQALAAIPASGPRAFGYDLDYVPFGDKA